MGAFYGSIHIRTEDADAIQRTLDTVAKEADSRFLLGPALKGWISVFPKDAGQSDRISAEIAKCLPYDVFHLIVHDDSIFSYYFYRDGRLIDRYNSCPDYFGNISDEEKQQCQGHPELFRELLPEPKSLGKLETLLTADTEEKFTFEQERMAQFVELLGLSNALSSYLDIKNGRSGTLLKPPEEVSVWRLELTSDRKALCCHCGPRPSSENHNKKPNYLQVWNYPALCKVVGVD